MAEHSKDWIGNGRLYATNHRKREEEVAAHDLYCTHPESMQLFFNKCKQRGLVLPHKVWEPCCGLGSISDELIKQGHDVLSTDLIDRGYGEGNVDLLTLTRETLRPEWKDYMKCIITNPPYKYATECIEKSLELLDNDGLCVMFLKTTFLESQSRVPLFNKHKLKYVWQYVSRQGCGKNTKIFENSGAAAYAMYIWDNSYNGLPEIDWIETPKKEKK